MRGAVLVVLLACLSWPLDGRAQLAEGLAGRWAGVVASDGAERPVRLTLAVERGGFALDITLPDAPPLRARMVPTEEPRVYQVAAASRGLFGFFDGGGGTDPLDGEPLIWARTTATGVIAYRLAIAPDGGMGLLRIAIEPAEDGLHLRVERRIDAQPPTRWQTLLEPAG